MTGIAAALARRRILHNSPFQWRPSSTKEEGSLSRTLFPSLCCGFPAFEAFTFEPEPDMVVSGSLGLYILLPKSDCCSLSLSRPF